MAVDHERILTPRTGALLILIGGAAFCAVLVLMVLVDPADRLVTKPSSLSRSAVGHAALASLLRESGYHVEVNRSRQGRGVAAEDLLLVLEPDLGINTVEDMQRLLAGKRRVLVALPKWRQRATVLSAGVPPGWIGSAAPVSESAVGKVAQGVLGQAAIDRPKSEITWTGRLGSAPEIERPQLVTDSALRPLVASSDGGVLVGEVPVDETGSRILVLADPDLIANHGLHRGDNALLAFGLIEQLLTTPDAAVHFDESLHGFAIVPSLPRLLLTPPFVAATLLALATVAVMVWRAAIGFGTERPGNEGTPVFGSGHETLLRNAGRLLAAGNHGAYIADRYGHATLEEAARRLHVDQGGPRPEDRKALRGTLQAIAGRRGVRTRLPEGQLRPLATARRYYDWMEEMLGGYRRRRDSR